MAGVEPLGQAEHRRALRETRGDLAERVAGDGHDEDVGVRDLGQRDRGDVAHVHIRQVALVAAGLGDRPRLLGIANRERDLVPASARRRANAVPHEPPPMTVALTSLAASAAARRSRPAEG